MLTRVATFLLVLASLGCGDKVSYDPEEPTRDDGNRGTPTEFTATEAHESDIDFGWISAGQPSEARVREVVALGARIISLRQASENPGFDEEAVVAELDGEFIRYGTSGEDYKDVAFREGIYDIFDAQRELGGPVYVHCTAANRAGASWALYHAERLGLDAEDALAKGKQAGLSSLEPTVKDILGLD